MLLSILKTIAIACVSAFSFLGGGTSQQADVPSLEDKAPKYASKVVENTSITISADDMINVFPLYSVELSSNIQSVFTEGQWNSFEYPYSSIQFSINGVSQTKVFTQFKFNVGGANYGLSYLCFGSYSASFASNPQRLYVLEYFFASSEIKYSLYHSDWDNYSSDNLVSQDVVSFSVLPYLSYDTTSDNNYLFNVNFLDKIANYVHGITEYQITSYDLNNARFSNLANYILSLDSYAYQGVIQLSSYNFNEPFGYLVNGNLQFEFFGTPITLILDSTSEFFGLWSYNNGFFNFNYDIYLITNNTEIYSGLVSAIQYDVEHHNLNDVNNYYYQFDLNFNYNALYKTSIDSPVVADSYFSSSSVVYKYITYNFPLFTSNGIVFNQIKLKYGNAYDKYFYIINDVNGQKVVKYFEQYNYGFYLEMYYVNSYNGNEILVHYRENNSVNTSTGYTNYYGFDSSWVNQAYREITFVVEPNQMQQDILANFNKYYDTSASPGDNGSLKQSFFLINMALNGLTGFFNITILPGITLGTLILIPFAVSLMLFVIYLFKR